MTLQVLPVTFNFDAFKGDENHVDGFAPFSGAVQHAFVALTSFDVFFSNKDEHPLGRLKLSPQVINVQGGMVTVRLTYLLRDWSGEIDDEYEGTASALVIADVA
jgi:hypothetical protein